MSEEMVVKHCSPTLAGMKTGNLFTCEFKNLNELKNRIQGLNYILNKKGVFICTCALKKESALIYVYRPKKLFSDISQKDAREILFENGYESFSVKKCIDRLSMRLKENDEFPYEIGLFLGYPPNDVKGFIKNKGRNCICTGYWKVYEDEAKAQGLFEKYKKCTKVYLSKLTEGFPLQRLTVAVN